MTSEFSWLDKSAGFPGSEYRVLIWRVHSDEAPMAAPPCDSPIGSLLDPDSHQGERLC